MQRLLSYALSAALLSTTVFGGEPSAVVVPPNPDSRDFVKVVTWTACPDFDWEVTRGDGQIHIDFVWSPDVGGCVATPPHITTTIDIGHLDPGEWEIVVGGRINERFKIDVRGVDPFNTFPAGLPTTGGEVRIATDLYGVDPRKARVFFGDVEAQVRLNEGALVVDAPPHPPGIVDVTVHLTGKTLIARHAFKYYEPSPVPDPFVFEPLLFSSAYEGAGVGGAEWRSENVVKAGRRAVPVHPATCPACPATITTATRLETPSRPDGLLLWIDRSGLREIAASSRIRDVARQESAGSEAPVVGLRDFRGRIELTNLPVDRRSRSMLRVWAVPDVNQVRFWLSSEQRTSGSRSLKLFRLDGGLPFAAADLTPLLAQFSEDELVTVFVSGDDWPIWAMATVTNNETHHVTVMAPRPPPR